ncbi:MAG: hypothetical protein JW715_09595 [Sedimentisphaerales bacterium]|nr:hypothetical protein [Sedimentisphaerales bacterium]
MRNVKNRMDSRLYGNQKDNHNHCADDWFALGRSFNVPVPLRQIIIVLTVLFLSQQAFGQYMVQPMEMKLQPTAGKMIPTALRIHNLDQSEILNIYISVVELSQKPNGEWELFNPDPNSPDYIEGLDISRLSSCSQWVSLQNSSVSIDPLAEQTVEVIVRVPPGVSGFYGAGILTSLTVIPQGSDVGYNLRYLVPVLIEISGRTIAPKIKLLDVDMENIESIGENPATTNVSLNIENIGQTYSRLKPFARLEQYMDGHWRLITRAEFSDTGIIPGSKLNLKSDILRTLPSGRYKVAGAIYVDGKPGGAIQKEIDFVGPPAVQRAATDAPLDLDPKEVVIEGLPGSTRTTTLMVHNASDSTVNVQGLFGVPSSISGKVSPTFSGKDLACAEWLRIDPPKFTLRSYQERRVRIIAEIPESASDYPWHYAALGLYAHYPDGQSAGRTVTNVCVGDRNFVSQPMIQPGTLKINDHDPAKSQFYVWIDFTNFGQVHFTPNRCRAGIAYTTGPYIRQVRSSATLSSDESGILLPLERRSYSGVLDLSSVEEGIYALEANLEYGTNQRISKQCLIQVSVIGQQRFVKTTMSPDELAPNDVIQINW